MKKMNMIPGQWLGNNNITGTFFRIKLLQLIFGGGPLPPVSTTITGISPLALVNAVAGTIGPLYRYGWCKHEPAEYLSSIVQQGKVEQNGTPTPEAPVDILCNNGVIRYGATGNNLAEMSEKTVAVGRYISATGSVNADVNNFFYQPYIPVTPNTTYTLTASQTCYFISISEYQADKTFIVRNTGSTNITELTITTGADTYFIRFGSNMDRASMSLEKVLDVNWMLNEGNALPYEPFVGGIITDGTPEVLSVGGKNLFYNDEAWEEGLFVTSGKVGAAGANRTFIMRCAPNTTYYWKHCSLVGGMRVFTVDADTVEVGVDGTWIKQNPVVGEINEVYSATTGANAKWLCVCFGRNQNGAAPIADQWSDFMLSVSPLTADMPYEPYRTPQTASVQNLYQVGDYADTQDIISGTVNHKVGVKVLDGTEEWTKISSINGYYITIGDMKVCNPPINGLSSHFIGTNVSNASMPDGSVKNTYASATDGAVSIRINSAETVEDFKAYLADQYAAGTPVIVLYPLAEETTETVDGNEFQWDYVRVDQASVSDISITTAKSEFTVPSTYHPLNILCNNGVVTASGALGPVETITLSADGVPDQTFTVEDLLGVGDYKDMEEVVSGIVTRKVGIKVLDGTETWGQKNASDGRIITRLTDAINQASAPILVSHGQWSTTSTADSDEWRLLAGPYLCCYSSEPTTADFKNYLAQEYANGTPVTVVYPLGEETTEQVTPHELTVADGTNTLTSTADDAEMSVTYMALSNSNSIGG